MSHSASPLDDLTKAAGKKPPGKFKKLLGGVASLPKRLFSASLPVRAAVAMAVFLVLLVLVTWTVFFFDPHSVPWRHSMTFGRMLGVLVLTILIPLVLYRCLALWLEGDGSRHPEVDFAWEAGLAALKRNGLNINAAPIFLVLGSSGAAQEIALLDAAGLALRVRETPPGDAPLHWYATSDAVYLVVTRIGCLSALAGRAFAEKSAGEGGERSAEMASTPSGAEGGWSATVDRPSAGGAMPSAAMQSGGGGYSPLATFEIGQGALLEAFAGTGGGAAGAGDATASASGATLALSALDIAEQTDRLRYVCRLLRRKRRPLCAINGILALAPYDLLHRSPREAVELAKAVKTDLRAVTSTLELRCPVTALVVGMEREPGFCELVRRVGRERAVGQRFGQRFDLRSMPTAVELRGLCAHVCGAFEDWVYTLFREKGALSRPGNPRLYGLLCQIRTRLQDRLADVLADGFGFNPALQSADDSLLFSGCYFAATGDTEDRQAFIRGVFNKLLEEQEEVEWSRRGRVAASRFRNAAVAGLLVDAGLAATFATLLIQRIFR